LSSAYGLNPSGYSLRMSILRSRLLRTSSRRRSAEALNNLCLDSDEEDMLKDVNMQTRATKALLSYVEEVAAGFEQLLQAHEKLRDGVFNELDDAPLVVEAPLNRFVHAAQGMRQVAASTKVALEVHHNKLSACSVEVARADAAAALQSLSFSANVQKEPSNEYMHSFAVHDTSTHSSPPSSPRRRLRKATIAQDRERLEKLAHDAEVQRAVARSALETCVRRKSMLLEIAQQTLQAVAGMMQTTLLVDIPKLNIESNAISSMKSVFRCQDIRNPFHADQMDQDTSTMQTLTPNKPLDTPRTTIRSNSIASMLSDSSCDDIWNPFQADLMDLGYSKGVSREVVDLQSADLQSSTPCATDVDAFSIACNSPVAAERRSSLDDFEIVDQEPIPNENIWNPFQADLMDRSPSIGGSNEVSDLDLQSPSPCVTAVGTFSVACNSPFSAECRSDLDEGLSPTLDLDDFEIADAVSIPVENHLAAGVGLPHGISEIVVPWKELLFAKSRSSSVPTKLSSVPAQLGSAQACISL